jgi:hypothetical protein
LDGILVITGQRSGAGHLFALLENLPEIAARDDLFPETLRDAPGRIDLAEIEARAELKRVIALKATTSIPREMVEQDILSRPGMRAMFVVRRQIDAYVSLAKATAMDVWRDADTSGIKVKLDIDRFARWLDDETDWYAHWIAWLEKRHYPTPTLRYETHLMVPPESALRRFVAAAAQVGISLKVPAALPHAGLKQQDLGKAAAFKVANWPEFSKALIERGLEKRAFGYPI